MRASCNCGTKMGCCTEDSSTITCHTVTHIFHIYQIFGNSLSPGSSEYFRSGTRTWIQPFVSHVLVHIVGCNYLCIYYVYYVIHYMIIIDYLHTYNNLIHICLCKSYVFPSGRNPIKAIEFRQLQVLEKLLPGDLQSFVAIWCRWTRWTKNGDWVTQWFVLEKKYSHHHFTSRMILGSIKSEFKATTPNHGSLSALSEMRNVMKRVKIEGPKSLKIGCR